MFAVAVKYILGSYTCRGSVKCVNANSNLAFSTLGHMQEDNTYLNRINKKPKTY